MFELKANYDACEGHGNCVQLAPDHFDLGEDGVVIITNARFGDSDLGVLEAAVRSCPVSALWIERH